MTIKFQNTKDFAMVVGKLGGTGLAVDDNPNTTEPATARCTSTPKPTDDGFVVMSLVSDAPLTVEGWIWSEKIGRWFKLFSQVLAADIISQITNVPINVPITLRVTVNAGATATVLGAMFA